MEPSELFSVACRYEVCGGVAERFGAEPAGGFGGDVLRVSPEGGAGDGIHPDFFSDAGAVSALVAADERGERVQPCLAFPLER